MGLIAFARLFLIMSLMAYAQIAEYRSLKAQRIYAQNRSDEVESDHEDLNLDVNLKKRLLESQGDKDAI